MYIVYSDTSGLPPTTLHRKLYAHSLGHADTVHFSYHTRGRFVKDSISDPCARPRCLALNGAAVLHLLVSAMNPDRALAPTSQTKRRRLWRWRTSISVSKGTCSSDSCLRFVPFLTAKTVNSL